MNKSFINFGVMKLFYSIAFLILCGSCLSPNDAYLEATIDGVVWKVKNPDAFFWEGALDDGTTLTIIRASSNSPPGSIINIQHGGVLTNGSFNIGNYSTSASYYSDNIHGGCVLGDENGLLIINIKTAYRLKGSFYFTVYKGNGFFSCEDVHITEGTFDLIRRSGERPLL